MPQIDIAADHVTTLKLRDHDQGQRRGKNIRPDQT